MISISRAIGVLLAVLLSSGCATLGQLKGVIQAPRFEEARDRRAEVVLSRPAVSRPLGGASVRLWMNVTNPNPFGFTLSTLRTTLMLEGNRAATADFPLGLPLRAGESTLVPLDLAIDFADVPGLATVVRSAAGGRAVAYRLEGTIGVDVGRLGRPTFGPMDLVSGELRVGIGP